MTTTFTPAQLTALKDMAKEDGHIIFKVEFGQRVAKAFGFKLRTQTIKDERSQFKGAYFPDLNEGDTVEGVDAHSLMYQVADAIGYSIKADYFGRGSQYAAGMAELLALTK